jgi:DNA-binding MarR family transcriptional regulator
VPIASDSELRLLMALRLSSIATVDDVARRSKLEVADVDGRLDDLVERGLVRHRDGLMVGWTLTPDGRREVERLAAGELDSADARSGLESLYDQFTELNSRLLAICTDWQLIEHDGERRPNSHDDPAHDAEVVASLRRLHAEARPVVGGLGDLIERFAGYGPRLESAMQKVTAGERDWFTKPTIDSYHTVWFELHEHLLATLGIERSTI